jgi:hypothetical protein
VLFLLTFAPAARSDDYCLNAPACTGTTVATVAQAFTAASANAVADTLTIGPSATPYPATNLNYSGAEPFVIRGAGADRTVLKATPGATQVMRLRNSTVTEMEVDVSGTAFGLILEPSRAERLSVVGAPTNSAVVLGGGAEFVDGQIDVSTDGVWRFFAGGTPAVVSDTTIVAGRIGAGVRSEGLALTRVRIDAPTGVLADTAGAAAVTDSAIFAGSAGTGVSVTGGSAELIRATVVGGAGATGVSTDLGGNGVSAGATLRDSIVSTTGGTDLAPTDGTITTQNSNFMSWIGSVGVVGSYVPGDPRFADRAAGDLRLRGDSPLIDRGLVAVAPGAIDFAGAARAVDGNGDGTAMPDLGAFERQGFTATAAAPASGTAGSAIAFVGSATGTVPNDPLTYSWEFDDGGSATGRDVAHVFTAAGQHGAVLTVTDGAGARRTANVAVQVDAPPAALGPSGGGDPPPPVGGGDRPPPTGGGVADLTPPAIGLSFPPQRLRRLSSRGIFVTVNPSEPSALRLTLSIDAKTARALRLGRRALVVGRAATRVGRTRTLRIKVPVKVRAALKRARRVKLTLRGDARDEAGNSGPIVKSLTLKR